MYWLIEPSGSGQAPPIIGILSSLLEREVARNEQASTSIQSAVIPAKFTAFHGLRAPSIGIEKYLERIFKYANCSPSCFVVAYAYIDRFIHQQRLSLPITSLNVHRLLITSAMVAAKFMDDAYYNNAYYAKVGGVTPLEMNRLELEFLFALRFRLHITVSTFESYCSLLQREMMLCDGFQIEKPILQYWCGQRENSVQEKTQKTQQQMAVWCSYAGV
nr:cyclin U 4;1 [Larix kaempferi]